MFVWLQFKNESSAFWHWQQKHRVVSDPLSLVSHAKRKVSWCVWEVFVREQLGCELVTEGQVSAVGQSGGHFFQVLRQYLLKKLYLGRGACARVAGKNLQVRSQNLPCGESERSLAVIIIIIDYNNRQHQLCSVNGRSLSICYYFAGNCHRACDWMQKDKTTHPFTLFQSH